MALRGVQADLYHVLDNSYGHLAFFLIPLGQLSLPMEEHLDPGGDGTLMVQQCGCLTWLFVGC